MFVININYKSALKEIDKYLALHREFLDKYIKNDSFIISGAKNPRTGGVILAYNVDHNELKSIINEDPFYINDLADYEIIEFIPTKINNKILKIEK